MVAFGYEIYSTLLPGYAQTAVDKIPKELAKLARAKNIPADWTSPHKHSGCQLSLQLVDESLQFKKTSLFRGLAALRILLAGDDVNRTPINGG